MDSKIKHKSKVSEYPYQNKSLKNMKGEIWKDIPDFEGIYQASSLGRVKSLDREIPHPRLKKQFVKGRILSQSIAKNKNVKTGEPMTDLRVSLCNEGIQYYFNTRRVIYTTFVLKLNYEKDGIYVINKDCDGYNNSVSNLDLMTKSEKQKRVFKRGRQDSHLKTADRSKWVDYGGATRRKAILQYNLKGKFVALYESISEASRKTGIGEKEIIQVAKGLYSQWKGFIWQYAKKRALPVMRVSR